MTTLAGKTLFITGASRGIGLAIALRAARDGANIVIAAKSNVPNPRLPGTIHTAAAEIEAAGGMALPLKVDIREEAEVRMAAATAAERFGGIDILVNNASAIWLAGVEDTPMKRFDLMHEVNTRGTFLTTQACLPFLKHAPNPHVLMLSPPPSIDPRWYAPHVAYTIAKFGMSHCVLGMAPEFAPMGIAVNALWPRTVIATAAIAMLGDTVRPENCRIPEIVAGRGPRDPHETVTGLHRTFLHRRGRVARRRRARLRSLCRGARQPAAARPVPLAAPASPFGVWPLSASGYTVDPGRPCLDKGGKVGLAGLQGCRRRAEDEPAKPAAGHETGEEQACRAGNRRDVASFG